LDIIVNLLPDSVTNQYRQLLIEVEKLAALEYRPVDEIVFELVQLVQTR
jgi:hypothetical protein